MVTFGDADAKNFDGGKRWHSRAKDEGKLLDVD